MNYGGMGVPGMVMPGMGGMVMPGFQQEQGMSSGKKAAIFVLVLLVLGGIGTGVYFALRKKPKTTQAPSGGSGGTVPSAFPTFAPERDEPRMTLPPTEAPETLPPTEKPPPSSRRGGSPRSPGGRKGGRKRR